MNQQKNNSQSAMQTQIILLFSRDAKTGDKIFSYLKSDSKRLARLQDSIKHGKADDLGNFGEIIYSGTGKPNDLVKRYMLEEYNFVG